MIILKSKHITNPKDMTLCEICSHTHLSSCMTNPHKDSYLYKAIGWIGNRILEEIRKNNGSRD